MNRTIAKYDLITAENIMRYLEARRDELDEEYAWEFAEGFPSANETNLPYLKGRLHEVHELLANVRGDLESMIKEMGDHLG